jgi:hypothetical protein
MTTKMPYIIPAIRRWRSQSKPYHSHKYPHMLRQMKMYQNVGVDIFDNEFTNVVNCTVRVNLANSNRVISPGRVVDGGQ